MRVASRTIYDVILKDLSKVVEDMFQANKTVATEKRINDLSDDPVGLMQALNIKSSLNSLSQLDRNITMGISWLKAGEGALSHAHDLVSEARAIAVKMANATANRSQRAAAAENVRNILEEIVSLGNTQVNGRYIFSGNRTDAAAFDGDGEYNGDKKPFTIKVGSAAAYLQVGAVGEEAFGTVFSDLGKLKTALEANDVGGITEAMETLGGDLDHLSARQSEIGSKTLRMEVKARIIGDLQITGADRLSTIEDADMAEAITRLQSKELAYKAALASSAKVMNLSLVDFVR